MQVGHLAQPQGPVLSTGRPKRGSNLGGFEFDKGRFQLDPYRGGGRQKGELRKSEG